MLFKMEGFDCIILKLKFERVFQHILLSLGFRSWWMGFSNSIPIMEGSILGHFNSLHLFRMLLMDASCSEFYPKERCVI